MQNTTFLAIVGILYGALLALAQTNLTEVELIGLC